MATGKKTGGRIAGVPNKLGGLAKDNIAAVFNKLGGTTHMAEWAKENPTPFYQIYAKLLPLNLEGELEHTHTVNKIELVALDGNSTG